MRQRRGNKEKRKEERKTERKASKQPCWKPPEECHAYPCNYKGQKLESNIVIIRTMGANINFVQLDSKINILPSVSIILGKNCRKERHNNYMTLIKSI